MYMKKKIIATITMLCLLTVLYNYLRLPGYHITNSISFSSADTRDTELTVIVYKCWKIDGLIKDIENEHNKSMVRLPPWKSSSIIQLITCTIIANHSELQPLNIIKKNSTLLLLLK